MSHEVPRFLVVENVPQWVASIRRALQVWRPSAVVEEMLIRAVVSDRELTDLLEASWGGAEALDSLDGVFVDVELDETRRHDDRRRIGSHQGGSVVLPWFRRKAPWVPVMALTGLLDSPQDRDALYVGAYGFDAAISKAILRLPAQEVSRVFVDVAWPEIWDAAVLRRTRIALSDEGQVARTPDSVAWHGPTHLRDHLSVDFPGWQQCLVDLFSFAARFTIAPLAPGRSKAAVAIVTAEHAGTPATLSTWVAKFHSSPSELQREAQAHRQLLEQGVSPIITVPIRAPSVLRSDRAALIAYHCAENTKTAGSVFIEDPSLVQVSLAQAVASLRGFRAEITVTCGDFFQPWCKDFSHHAKKCEEAGLTFPIDQFRSFEEVGLSALGAPRLSISTQALHGDLHLDNILLGGQSPLIIDFAKRGLGPIAFDHAKLLTDCARRAWDTGLLSHSEFPLTAADWEWFGPIESAFELSRDDRRVSRIFGALLYVQMLGYQEFDGEKHPARRAAFLPAMRDFLSSSRWIESVGG